MGVADVFPIEPDYPTPREIDDNVLITQIEGQLERRKLVSSIQLRSWDLNTTNMPVADQKLLNAFYLARKGRFDPFSFLPPINHDRLIEGLSVGIGDGATVDFDLDNTDFFRRVYLGAGNRNVGYVDGSPVGVTFSNNDGAKTSKVTYDVPPGGSTVLTVDIDRYLICRFDSALKDRLVAFPALSASYSFRELARDSI